ncbi:hypothetical protein [Rhodococcoides kroppenstedtii]|uniref:hypothetical protein n=1 Tax=Rhodococcoides kroppenstedtii TaxID=293050 RepID=UPI0028E9A7AB|nr:hypothetical protein [Rhodococcus kroppenstedtii]
MKDSTPAAVLAYHLQGSTVTAELLAAADGSVVGPPAVVTLGDLTAEQIGLSVPSLWRLVDDADVTVTCAVVTGLAADVDAAPPILELALDVPVHRAPSPTVVVDSRGSAPWDRSAPQRLRPARPVPAAPGRRPAEPTRESVPASDASRPGRVASAALTQAGEAVPTPPADARPAPADDDAPAPNVAGPASSDDVTEAFAVVVDDEPVPAPVSTTDGRRTRAGTLVAASAAAILVAAGIAGLPSSSASRGRAGPHGVGDRRRPRDGAARGRCAGGGHRRRGRSAACSAGAGRRAYQRDRRAGSGGDRGVVAHADVTERPAADHVVPAAAHLHRAAAGVRGAGAGPGSEQVSAAAPGRGVGPALGADRRVAEPGVRRLTV